MGKSVFFSRKYKMKSTIRKMCFKKLIVSYEKKPANERQWKKLQSINLNFVFVDDADEV